MRHTLINKAVTDVAVGGLFRRDGSGNFTFFDLAVTAVGEKVERIPRTHDASAGERQRDATRINRDPAASPLLGNGGCRAAATGRV